MQPRVAAERNGSGTLDIRQGPSKYEFEGPCRWSPSVGALPCCTAPQREQSVGVGLRRPSRDDARSAVQPRPNPTRYREDLRGQSRSSTISTVPPPAEADIEDPAARPRSTEADLGLCHIRASTRPKPGRCTQCDLPSAVTSDPPRRHPRQPHTGLLRGQRVSPGSVFPAPGSSPFPPAPSPGARSRAGCPATDLACRIQVLGPGLPGPQIPRSLLRVRPPFVVAWGDVYSWLRGGRKGFRQEISSILSNVGTSPISLRCNGSRLVEESVHEGVGNYMNTVGNVWTTGPMLWMGPLQRPRGAHRRPRCGAARRGAPRGGVRGRAPGALRVARPSPAGSRVPV